MYTRHLPRLSRGLLAASLLLLTALGGCSDPGTSVETEKVKDDEAMALTSTSLDVEALSERLLAHSAASDQKDSKLGADKSAQGGL